MQISISSSLAFNFNENISIVPNLFMEFDRPLPSSCGGVVFLCPKFAWLSWSCLLILLLKLEHMQLILGSFLVRIYLYLKFVIEKNENFLELK